MRLLKKAIKSFANKLGYKIVPIYPRLIPDEMQKDWQAILEKIGTYNFKFLNLEVFIPTNLLRIHRLELHQAKALDILDLGTGTGYFPFICEYYGHRAWGLDTGRNVVFNDVTRWLGVKRKVWEIKAFEPIPSLGLKFDLITAYMTNFDRYGEDVRWGCREWDYFFQDLAKNHLNPGGRDFLRLNVMPEETRIFFIKHHAIVNGEEREVYFESMSSFLALA